ncbi:MAG TPA: ABC transporter permease subunit [Gaiellales bacterium]|nr:ABC transporter permease subunit [Gaiellales bacterium]
MELRLRYRVAASAGVGLIVVIMIVGALYPSLRGTFGKLSVPQGVANLLGGADYSTLTGWLQSEIVATYGPLVFCAVGITTAAATTTGDEDERVLATLLAHPVLRTRLLLAKTLALTLLMIAVSIATWLGLLAGVAIAGGGISTAHLAAQAVHLCLLGLTFATLTLALGASTGRKTVAAGGAAGIAILAFFLNGLAPLIGGLTWTRYLSPFYYYSNDRPLTNGAQWDHLAVLAAVSLILVGVALAGFRQRDLRS